MAEGGKDCYVRSRRHTFRIYAWTRFVHQLALDTILSSGSLSPASHTDARISSSVCSSLFLTESVNPILLSESSFNPLNWISRTFSPAPAPPAKPEESKQEKGPAPEQPAESSSIFAQVPSAAPPVDAKKIPRSRSTPTVPLRLAKPKVSEIPTPFVCCAIRNMV